MITTPGARENSWLDRSLFGKLDYEKLAYIALIVLAIASRFYDLGTRAMSHDESLHTYFSYNLSIGKGFQHTPLMHGPFLFHITALSYFLFGDSDFSSRLPYALMGVASVGLPWLFRRWLGRTGALSVALFILISPSNLYYDRYIRQEASIIVWNLLTVFSTWRYMETRQNKWLYLLTGVLAFHGADKSTNFFTVAQAAAFLGPLTLLQVIQAHEKPIRAIGFVAAVGAAIAGLSVAFVLVAKLLIRSLTPTVNISADAGVAMNSGAVVVLLLLVAAASVGTFVLSRLFSRLFGTWMQRTSEAAPAFSPLVIMVTSTLFMASAALLPVLNPIWRLLTSEDLVALDMLGNMSNLNSNVSVVYVMLALSLALISVAVAIGLAWNARMWVRVIGLFLAITVPLFTTLFTNPAGIATGFVGQLGYWMAQQGVMRGSQPWYYYFIVVPLYEYMLVFGALIALALFLYRAVTSRSFAPSPEFSVEPSHDDDPSEPYDAPTPAPRRTLVVPKSRVINLGFMEIQLQRNETVDAETGEPVQAGSRRLAPAKGTAIGLASNGPRQITDFGLLFPAFLIWFMVSNWLTYSAAGEKMPWLTIHIALPMAMLTGWLLDAVVTAVGPRWSKLESSSKWWLVALSILAVVFSVQVLSSIGAWPSDVTARTGALTALVVKVIALGVTLAGLWRVIGNRGLIVRGILLATFAFLSILTARTAIIASYINFDYTKEFLFYAHGGNTVKTGLDQLSELSKRLNGGNTIKVGYDSDSSWPISWYMRDFPNSGLIGDALPNNYKEYDAFIIGDYNKQRDDIIAKLKDEYTQYKYMLVWWPMEDYKNLDLPSIWKNLSNPRWRAAIWEIVFNREYKKYSEFYNISSLTPETWSPGHPYFLFVRNDVAARVWDYRSGAVATGQGNASLPPPPQPVVVNKNTGYGQIALLNNQQVVVDFKNNKVTLLDANGDIVASWGGLGSQTGKFNAPWGVAVDAQGSILIADTFNHRIQRFDRDGNFLSTWGGPGVTKDPGTGKSTQFFGPRDIAFDKKGQMLVTDTGNKRIQVFDNDGNFISQFGTEGTQPGQFNEPVGLAVDANGSIFVADTWNKRIQVFSPEFVFMRQFQVQEWQDMRPEDLQAVDNKPYLAVNGGTLFASSPKSHKVLAFNSTTGQRLETPGISLGANSLPTGLIVSSNQLYVSDGNGGGVQIFDLDTSLR